MFQIYRRYINAALRILSHVASILNKFIFLLSEYLFLKIVSLSSVLLSPVSSYQVYYSGKIK